MYLPEAFPVNLVNCSMCLIGLKFGIFMGEYGNSVLVNIDIVDRGIKTIVIYITDFMCVCASKRLQMYNVLYTYVPISLLINTYTHTFVSINHYMKSI